MGAGKVRCTSELTVRVRCRSLAGSLLVSTAYFRQFHDSAMTQPYDSSFEHHTLSQALLICVIRRGPYSMDCLVKSGRTACLRPKLLKCADAKIATYTLFGRAFHHRLVPYTNDVAPPGRLPRN